MTAAVADKGRVVLPKHIRDRLGLAPGTPVHFETDRGSVTIRPARDRGAQRLEWIRRLAGSIDEKDFPSDAPRYDADRIKKEVWGQ